ncbi:MAG: 50S ribosomal protein L11 methyltransferase [Fibrobacteria bacterium]
MPARMQVAADSVAENEKIWSSSDFPYQCLLDFKRTTAFQAAIQATVSPGDVVVDAGAGSGILSFFAARAGAKRVYAVEVDGHLADCLRQSAAANGLGNVIEVIEGDIHEASLPQGIDVFICEMMETGLLDEMQVTAINSLRDRQVLGPDTLMIPYQYETFMELGYTDFNYYGFKILIPRHDWPHHAEGNTGWLANSYHPICHPYRIGLTNLRQSIEPGVNATFSLTASSTGVINALRLSARAHLTHGMPLGATNALNGDKIIPLPEATRVEAGQTFRVRMRYRMGAGLASLQAQVLGG